MSSSFAGSDKWIPLFSINGGVKVQLTLDAAENVVKLNDDNGQANQSTAFEVSAAVLLWDHCVLDSQLQENISGSWLKVAHCCTKRPCSQVMMFFFHLMLMVHLVLR